MALWELTLTEMAAELAASRVSSEELLRAHLDRAASIGGKLCAFTQVLEAPYGLTAARAADAARTRGDTLGPLHGLPLTIKENLALVGTPATVGVKARRSQLATTTAPVIQAAINAGAVLLAKTNVPQLLLSMETHNDIWGTTPNPWNLARVPGGSSGGEAAAIASGMSPAGIGTDIGGSIRIPAAWCGIVGLKPTAGRWSIYGASAGQPGQEAVRAVAGPLARNMDDLLLLWEALSAEAQHKLDPLVPPIENTPVRGVSLKGRRVGIYVDDGVFTPAASVQRAVTRAGEALAAAGCELVPYTPPQSWEMVSAYFGLMSADGMVTARRQIGGEPITPQLQTLAKLANLPRWLKNTLAAVLRSQGEPRVASVLAAVAEKPTHELWSLVVLREALKRAELAAWSAAGLDLVLGPATVTPAARLGDTHDWSLGAWHTMRWNLLDQPAGVVPVSTVRPDEQVRTVLADRLDRKAATFEAESEGLPVSAQVIGRPWEEHLVLAAMRVIEQEVRGDVGFPKTPVSQV